LATLQIKRADIAGCGLSALCLAHCLALPLLTSFAPMLGAAFEAEWVHWAFVAFALPVALVAFLRSGVTQTARVMGAMGLMLLIAGAAELPSHNLETPVSVTGALLLAGAHLVNVLRPGHRHKPSGGKP